MATPTNSTTLATLLESVRTPYTVRFQLDGTWQVLDSSGNVANRGHQAEVMHWLALQEKTYARDFDLGEVFDLASGLIPGASSFSAGAWVNFDALAEDAAIIATGGISTTTGFRLRVRSNQRLRGDLRDTAGNQLTTDDGADDCPIGEWAHVALVQNRTSSTLKLYLNGAETLSVDSSSIGDINTASLKRIGAYSTTTARTNGRIARAFYADEALDTDDLAELIATAPPYDELSSALQAKMVGFWNLDETDGGAAVDAVGSNDGTATGTIGYGYGPP